MKDKYSIYEAKTHLSEILRKVRDHQEIIITDRGREVAKVVPLQAATTFEKRVQALERSGVIQGDPNADPRKIRPIKRVPGALKDFLENRHRF